MSADNFALLGVWSFALKSDCGFRKQNYHSTLPFNFEHMSQSVGTTVGQTAGFLGFLGFLGALGPFGFFEGFFLGLSGAAITLEGGPVGLHLFIIELKPIFSQFSKFPSSDF